MRRSEMTATVPFTVKTPTYSSPAGVTSGASPASQPASEDASQQAIKRATEQVSAALPKPSPLAAYWQLDPEIVLLNHGSFGATPRTVIAELRRWTDVMEREPVGFFVERLEPALDEARAALAAFIGCQADDFAFVDNASTGVSTIARSIPWRSGDVVITSDHEYNACNNALRLAAARFGVRIETITVPLDGLTEQRAVDLFSQALRQAPEAAPGGRRLLLLSHITSPSALVLPAKAIIARAHELGMTVLLDAAHSPGQVPLNLTDLDPDYATGNFHKWLCAPKGSAFLYVRRSLQHEIHPLTTSHGYNATRTDRSRFRLEFDFGGTRDAGPWLATPTALANVPRILSTQATWPDVMAANRRLASEAQALLCGRLGTAPIASPDLHASMALVPLPPHPPQLDSQLLRRPTKYADALQDALLQRHRIQVPIIRMPTSNARFVRLSAQLYNSLEQYHFLADALIEELQAERSR